MTSILGNVSGWNMVLIFFFRYHPSIPKEVHSRHRQYVESIIQGLTFENTTIEHLSKIISSDIFLDKFQDFLSENMKEEDEGIQRTYFQSFLNGINSDNFYQVLSLFETYGSRLFHAKIALFVSEVLQSAKAKPIVEKYTSENDLKNLSLIAYSMTFSNDTPLDIFPFDPATHASLLRVCQKFRGKSLIF